MQQIPNASDILQAVIDATPDAIFVKDLDGRYVLVNQAAAKFVGRIPAEVIGKGDLEPFFTTKTGGAGSGLGLSMVYGFAKQSGGAVHIASAVGRGTTVIIYLPLTKSEPLAAAPLGLPVAPPVVAYVVLVVEDEAAVRSTVRRQLETLGHTVVIAESAAAALPLLEAEPLPDVLLTDVVLGSGMNGIDLAAVPEAQQRISNSGAPLLAKPSTLSQLERAMSAVTSRSSPGTSTT